MTALIFSPISAAKHPAKELDLSMNSVTSDCLRQLVVWAADPSHGKEHKDRGGNAWKHLGTMPYTLVKLYRRHTTSPQKVADEGKSPYFRKIQVGEIL